MFPPVSVIGWMLSVLSSYYSLLPALLVLIALVFDIPQLSV